MTKENYKLFKIEALWGMTQTSELSRTFTVFGKLTCNSLLLYTSSNFLLNEYMVSLIKRLLVLTSSLWGHFISSTASR